jgi:hypothetical protein
MFDFHIHELDPKFSRLCPTCKKLLFCLDLYSVSFEMLSRWLIFILSVNFNLVSVFGSGQYQCNNADQGKLGSSFGSDYWSCIQSTRTSPDLEQCIESLHPRAFSSVTTSCQNCIANVFLLTGWACIIDCRTQTDSSNCNTCRSTVAQKWQSCVPSSSYSYSWIVSLMILVIQTLLMS